MISPLWLPDPAVGTAATMLENLNVVRVIGFLGGKGQNKWSHCTDKGKVV
jgi:hypothetical protein